MSVYCSMLKFSKVYDGLGVGKRGRGVGVGAGKEGVWAWPTIFFLSRNRFTFSCTALAFKLNERFFLLEKNTALRAFSCLIIIPIFFFSVHFKFCCTVQKPNS
jgi:hypothetical protein